ncbi:hypothetical protein MJO29_013039 [Puccinia striiformis f. sp. tritici]|nr:hypothetical protein MJO29_013039 [Puccinia striiformis f. sp. tritici]
MKLPLRTMPDHTNAFPLRSRTRPHHRLPKYMEKRPLLTIQIPSLIERVAKDERVQEVSCFSPFTPDGPNSACDSASSIETEKMSDLQSDMPDDRVQQSTATDAEDEEEENKPFTLVRRGSRWSRRLQHGCLQPIFHQAQRTPIRRKRLSTISVMPFSAIDFDLPRRTSPTHNSLINSRRRSNPFDHLSSRRYSNLGSPMRHDKTPTQHDIRPDVVHLSTLETLHGLNALQNLNPHWRTTTS